ncbi:MAG: hypothetical protein V1775_03905 [Bacteroidota bacterium]
MVKRTILSLLLMLYMSTGFSQATDSTLKVFSISGYVKELPYLQLIPDHTSNFDNILNLRLNLAANLLQSTRVVLELRNRLMFGDAGWGELASDESFRKGDGWLDLSVASEAGGRRGLVHLMADRFYLEHNRGKWQVRAGRQRINWGINMVSNPNDLFNTYSFFDFDYPERPGSDAVRVQYYRNEMSHAEVAFAPADHISDAVGAFLYGFNFKGYDVQLIGGYYHNRLALGGGWAGHIRGTGFKGEATVFDDPDGSAKPDIVASVSVDYLFQDGLYIFMEGLYNGGYVDMGEQILNLSKSLSADNILFSTYAVTTSVSYPFSPVFNGNLAFMMLPDINSLFISPSLSYSVLTNFDVSLISQIYGSPGKSNDRGIAIALIGNLQWSF